MVLGEADGGQQVLRLVGGGPRRLEGVGRQEGERREEGGDGDGDEPQRRAGRRRPACRRRPSGLPSSASSAGTLRRPGGTWRSLLGVLNNSAVRRALAILAATSLVVLAACGDDDGSDVRDTTAGTGPRPRRPARRRVPGRRRAPALVRVRHHRRHQQDQRRPSRRRGRRPVHGVRAGPGRHADHGRTRRSPTPCAPATSRRPRRRSPRPATPGSRSSRSPGWSSDIDGAVDARVDDFENEDDPAWTGWHKLEYLLWEKGDISEASGAPKLADQLDADLQKLKTDVAALEIPAAAIPSGAAELIEEVSGGKITGEEDRYSHTDLWDFAANVEGSQKAWELLKPAVEAKDADLATAIDDGFAEIDEPARRRTRTATATSRSRS